MRLSDYFENVIRDSDFDCIGKASDQPNMKMVTFLGKKSFLYAILRNPNIVAVVTTQNLVDYIPSNYGVVISSTPSVSLYKAHNLLCDKTEYIGNRFKSIIPESCNVHPSASISEWNVVLGERVTIKEFSIVKENTRINSDTVIDSNCVIGGMGFEFVRDKFGTILVRHSGWVEIGKNVTFLEGVNIEQGVFPWQTTIIGDSCAFDRQVLVGHGSTIGVRTFIAASSTICGHVHIGKDAWIGAKSVISNRLVIGDSARISIGSVVLSNISAGQTATGNPAVEHSVYLQDCLKKSRLSKQLRKRNNGET